MRRVVTPAQPTPPAVLRVHAIEPCTRTNGPGRRSTLWLQGCSLRCPGCFNPTTHAHAHGLLIPVDEVFASLAHPPEPVEGITISGGEPLEQASPLLALLRRVRAETSLSVLLFTGLPWEQAKRHADLGSLVDVVLAGPYVVRHHLAQGLRGSSNKTIHLLTPRYTRADLEAVPAAEIFIDPTGTITLTGIDPLAQLQSPPKASSLPEARTHPEAPTPSAPTHSTTRGRP